jgi:Uma2 family endonuclease
MATILEPAPRADHRPRLFTAEDVERMLDAGDLDDARVELIDGELIEMAPQWMPHMRTKRALRMRLEVALHSTASNVCVSEEATFQADQRSLPQPDIVVWDDRGGDKWLPAAQVRLVVEVCSTTHRQDFGRKVGLYATAGVPEYWIADLVARSVVVMWSPDRGVYAERVELPFGAPVKSPTLGVTIDTGGLDG